MPIPWAAIVANLKALFSSAFKPSAKSATGPAGQQPVTTIIIVGDGNTINHNQATNEIKINVHKALQEYPKDFPQWLKAAVLNQGQPISDAQFTKRLEGLKETKSVGPDHDLINRLEGKIPPEDIKALRAAIYIKKLFAQNNPDAKELKRQLRERCGLRGTNLNNIFSAGYFDNLILPLYETMSKHPGFTPDKFLKIYDVIIDQQAFSVFVHSGMTDAEVDGRVHQQLKQNLSLGQSYVNIHGIGKDNIKKIQKVVAAFEDDPKYASSLSKHEDRSGQILFIRLTIAA